MSPPSPPGPPPSPPAPPLAAAPPLQEDAADYSAALASGTARELLLFALHLHQSLPHCVPKGTVRFAGGLHETVVKEIELTNPSAKPVEYDVRLYGSPAFSIDRKRPTKGAPATCHLRLEPRAAITFAIEMSSAFTGATAGTLRFLSRGDGIGSSNASTLVFDLRAEVSIGQPMGVHAAEAKVYSPTTIALPVKPPPQLAAAFEGGGLVRVELFETRPPLEPTQPAGGGGRGGGRGKPAGRALGSPGKRVEASGFDADGVAKRLPKSFWSSAATGSAALKLDAKGEAILSVQFIPFQLGEYSCTVWIADPAAGEWSYRITGRVGLPPPLETLNFACEMAQSTVRELTLPYRNPQLERARLAVLDRSAKERERWSAVWGKDPIVRGQQALVGSSSSPAFSLPLKLDLVEAARPGGSASSRGLASRAPSAVPGTPRTGALGGAAVGGPDTNKLTLRFTPKEPGTYSGEVLLVSPLDVRMYQVHGTAKAPGIEATLEFVGPARSPLLQELPVVNGTDVEWNVTATLRGGDFSGPASIRVPPNSTGYFPLEFTPSWTEVCEGELTLTNSAVGDKYVYNLKGVGEEPLAEGHVVLDCTARKPKVLAFKVVNVSASGTSCEMKIDSDLLHVSGPPTVSVPGRAKSGSGGETSYQLTVNPLMGGTVQGSITFTAPDGRFLWYTVEIRAAPPPAERVIEVAAPLRKVRQRHTVLRERHRPRPAPELDKSPAQTPHIAQPVCLPLPLSPSAVEAAPPLPSLPLPRALVPFPGMLPPPGGRRRDPDHQPVLVGARVFRLSHRRRSIRRDVYCCPCRPGDLLVVRALLLAADSRRGLGLGRVPERGGGRVLVRAQAQGGAGYPHPAATDNRHRRRFRQPHLHRLQSNGRGPAADRPLH